MDLQVVEFYFGDSSSRELDFEIFGFIVLLIDKTVLCVRRSWSVCVVFLVRYLNIKGGVQASHDTVCAAEVIELSETLGFGVF